MELKNRKTVNTQSGSPITSITLNPFQNSKLYGFITFQNKIHFYNFQTLDLIFNYDSQFHKTINSICFLPYKSNFITCSNFIEFFDLKRKTPIRWIKPQINSNANNIIEDYDFNKVNDVVSLNDDVISTCDEKRQVCLYDLRQSNNYKPTQTFMDAKDSLNTLTYNPTTYTISTGSNDGKLYNYDIRMKLLTINEMDNVITKISGYDDTLLINRLNRAPLIFNTITEETQEIPRDTMDYDYKVGNCFVHGNGNGNGNDYGYLICSEIGKIYYYHENRILQYDLDKIGNGRILGCCDSYEQTVAVGDGGGVIDLFEIN